MRDLIRTTNGKRFHYIGLALLVEVKNIFAVQKSSRKWSRRANAFKAAYRVVLERRGGGI